MNLEKLYKLQEKLDNHILENEKKRTGKEIDKDLLLDQTILALLVEVGELANETRCFKHWSTKGPNDRQAIRCETCDGTGDSNYHMIMEAAESNMKHLYIECEECEGTGIIGYENPILEELADVWHFYLSIGNQIGEKIELPNIGFETEYKCNKAKINTFLQLYIYISRLAETSLDCIYRDDAYINIGYWLIMLRSALGFTDEEVEQAYLKKHEENYKRQREGY